jgi:hypothetical protein
VLLAAKNLRKSFRHFWRLEKEVADVDTFAPKTNFYFNSKFLNHVLMKGGTKNI